MALIDAAARELASIDLEDALRILLVMAKKGDERYGRAAARWAARVTAERRLGMDESRRVLALVDVLPEAPDAVAAKLRGICRPRRAGT
jgi:uncharacterized protein (DUF2384 family)